MDKRNLKGTVAVIVSAGLGKRMPRDARKKNFLLLNDRLVLVHTLLPFEKSSLISAIVIVTGEDDIEHCKEEVVNSYGLKKVLGVIAGGKERQDSVAEGLRFIREANLEESLVAIHDGARCLVTTELIDRVIDGARAKGAAAAMVPVKDTIKESALDGRYVERTLSRERLYSVQTPQAFDLKLLNRAMEEAIREGFLGTDSSSLVERIGEKVLIVEGSYENIKITTAEDLQVAKRLLSAREAGEKDNG
ncbi:MAG: 2-C-methyl-D-erythritol 4-phosphate cytidylyltransferase [Proteobacteria bacterium]|nr:2-C-methyl-D-erythritol 4-phosphate cytidylyltransferase [Pseudomonadota bacterium]